MVKILGNVVKPRAHGHLFCSALKFSLRNKALPPERQERASTRKASGKGGLNSKKGESVELRPDLKVENSARHYIRAVENYQQTTTAKHAVYNSLVEIAIQILVVATVMVELFGHANHGDREKMTTNYPWWTITIRSIPRFFL